jgi:hypothetical protein
MIKTVSKFTLIALIGTFFIACSDKEVEPKSVETLGCYIDGAEAPKWACVPEVDGYYAGVGIAQNSAAGVAHMRKVALANGRSDLAQQIEIKVKDKIEAFTKATGTKSNETVDLVTTAVTKQLANVNLRGSKAVDYWESPSKTIYMLVTIPQENVNKEVKRTILSASSSYNNDDARWQQFQSEQALKKLDEEFPTN